MTPAPIPYAIAALFDAVPRVSPLAAARHTIGKRLGRKLDMPLGDMPADLRIAVEKLAAQYRKAENMR